MQNMGRKPNVGAHNNWGVPAKVLTSMNNAPWCVVRKSLLYPPIELHGHRGTAWRVIECVLLVTDYMGRVYIRLSLLFPPKMPFARKAIVFKNCPPLFYVL
jgi:hypothetical protein